MIRAKKDDEQYSVTEAKNRFRAALQGAKKVAPIPYESMTPKGNRKQRKVKKAKK